MFASVMVVFVVYAVIFIVFEDYDRRFIRPFNEASDWHLLLFSLVVMMGLGWLLHGYARRMDERISREQQEQHSQMRRELTQNIAHELKTPVASILGYTDTILESPGMDEATRHKFISRANAQARRLTALLQDISTLNKMDYASDRRGRVGHGGRHRGGVRAGPRRAADDVQELPASGYHYQGQLATALRRVPQPDRQRRQLCRRGYGD